MDENLIREVKECLRGERTLFHYYPEKYAIYLLSRVVAEKEPVAMRDLRSSQFATLLNRPIVKNILQFCGDGYLTSKIIDNYWRESMEPFVLTLGEWGSYSDWTWQQVSRPGKNLVLQLNVSNKWVREIQSVFNVPMNILFDRGHPVSESRSLTLAWARIDIDFDTNEALIEELQSDSVRDLSELLCCARSTLKQGRCEYRYYGCAIDARKTVNVADAFLSAFNKIWQEAMLTAAISFVFEELGITSLYYHNYETGNQLKNLRWAYPPRSLYTELPRKFCFVKTSEAPVFLQREKKLSRKLKKMKGGRWFHMAA